MGRLKDKTQVFYHQFQDMMKGIVVLQDDRVDNEANDQHHWAWTGLKHLFNVFKSFTKKGVRLFYDDEVSFTQFWTNTNIVSEVVISVETDTEIREALGLEIGGNDDGNGGTTIADPIPDWYTRKVSIQVVGATLTENEQYRIDVGDDNEPIHLHSLKAITSDTLEVESNDLSNVTLNGSFQMSIFEPNAYLVLPTTI